MHALLYRVGGSAAAHPWRTVAVWIVLLVSAFGLAGAVGGTMHDDYDIPDAPAQAGTDLLRQQFPQLGGSSARVVLHDAGGRALDPALVDGIRNRLAVVPHVDLVQPAIPSADGDTALFQVAYDAPVTDLDATAALAALQDATAAVASRSVTGAS